LFKYFFEFSDDLNLSIDFFQYFEAMNKVLFADKTLFCVSAWNDNGKLDVIQKDPGLLLKDINLDLSFLF
jgi:alpha-1,3-mannosyl-glycoprotein beta-1,2-N-acetylglucosaminyltransferase